MANHNGKEIGMVVEVIIHDPHAEIDLDGSQLLKLKFGQVGTTVICTAGALWLTQQGDLHDHILKSGQSFSLDRRGSVLVQGLPQGRVLIWPPDYEGVAHIVMQLPPNQAVNRVECT